MEKSMVSRRFLITHGCAVGLGCLLVFAALPGGGAQIPNGRPVPLATVAKGKVSRVRVPEHLVVRDDAAWLALWRRHTGPDAGPPPPVNFDRDMVIAVFAG